MSEENWKLEKDLCRCCLSEGSFKNLAEPFQNLGEEEILSDMLVETLDVNISPVAGPLCTSTYTICEECVLRLRDACSFKRQVLLSEKRFHDLYTKDIIQLHSSHLDLKQEVPDSDNEEAVKMEAEDDDDDDFRINYENEHEDKKLDVQYELIEDLDGAPAAKRAKAKKPKAKEKPKPKPKRAPRPKKVKAEGEAPEEAQEQETKKKKDKSIEAEDGNVDIGGQTKNACNTCSATYKSLRQLALHEKTHAAKNETEIKRPDNEGSKNKPSNGSPTTIKSDADYTRESNGSATRYKCKLCKASSYKSLKEIKFHIKNKHKTPASILMITCDICKEEFKEQCLFEKHIKSHSQADLSKSNVCKICKVSIAEDMKNHLQSHNTFQCRKCPAEFPRKRHLGTHEREAHGTGPSGKIFVCDACGKNIRGRERDIIRHLRQHGFFKCPVCPKVCSNRKRFDEHNRVKHPVKLYDCSACNHKSKSKSALLIHQRRMHMNERNEVCSQCNARFCTSIELENHMVRHNPVKKYECRFCRKKFPRPETVKRHEMIHTGVKKKVCQVCDARFVQKTSLSFHLKKYHPEAV